MFLPMLVVLLNLESGIYHETQKTPDVWTTKQDYADVEDSTLPVLQKLMVSLVWIKTVQRADISPLNV